MLVFRDLVVKNFGSFRGEHKYALDKNPGLYFIRGVNKLQPTLTSNDAGKSTFFADALCWCLTGTTIRDQRPGGSVESWDSKGEVSVSLTVQCRDAEHQVFRSRRPNRLQLDGREVQQVEIDRIIGLTDATLRRTVLIGQFGTLFLDLTPEEQAKMFTEILDLDVWLAASDRANKRVAERGIELRKLQDELNRTRGSLDEVISQYNDVCDAEDDFEDEMKDQVAEQREALQALEAEKAQNAGLEGGVATPQELAAIDEACAHLRADWQTKKDEREELSRTIAAKQSTFVILQRLKEKYEAASKAEVCPECGQKVAKVHIATKIREANREVSRMEDTIALLQNDLAILDKEVSELRLLFTKKETAALAERQRIDEMREKQFQAARQEERHKEAIANVKKKIEELKARVNPYTERADWLKKRHDQFKADVSLFSRQVLDAEEEVQEAKFWVGAFKEIRLKEIDEALQELEIATTTHAQALGLRNWSLKLQTERVTQSGSVSTKFTAMIFPPDSKTAIPWKRYGGGVSQRWQIAVALGLAEVLLARAGITPNIQLFDEPSHHMSEGGVENLIEYLKERSQDLRQAIFFIDHHHYASGEFDGIITVEKDKTGSHIV